MSATASDGLYLGKFTSWEDVVNSFSKDVPEPDEVLFAKYTYEDYSGFASVLYPKGNKYYLNECSHCSCYGLEGQWNPEEYETKEVLLAALTKASAWYTYKDEMLAALGAKGATG